ncbi:hypothetical protein HYPDE_35523 [Hyphomicrobium denitrificans 1NES1]|uniref:Uncharacterized protein n=1 Tax=Hyphomicrobium denitrificans 1NES1 TaxID=670307 RepID=N0BE35_9HYPH|nr:hypothetical protein [Hyphomicrobium denitrificans]AGK58776.1 hypothetical protein HYPDE_35523 [Hyphomicrobium denitrificans 1NES1]
MAAFLSPLLTTAAAALVLMGSAGLTITQAAPGAGAVAVNQASSDLVRVHDDGYRWRHRRHHRRYYRGQVVGAPFAHVESGRRTIVDAPFVHVYEGRHGTHVVAPFVDLWEPR